MPRHMASRVGNPHRVEDLHFRIRGPVVAELQRVFIDDWWFVTGEKLKGDRFDPPLEHAGTALCRGVSDGPNQEQEKLRHLLRGAIACARQRIQIISYGEERPFSIGSGESAWKLNRRSHFVIVAR